MPEKRQRFICRLIFLVACLLPTTLLGWQILTSQNKSRWTDLIRDELGIKAEIESLVTPQPGLTRLQNVSLIDYSHGHLIDLDEIVISQSFNGGTDCYLPAFRIEATQLPQLWQRAQYALRNQQSLQGQVHFSQITVVHRSPQTNRLLTQCFRNCRLQIRPAVNGYQVAFDFQVPQTAASANESTVDGQGNKSANLQTCSLTINTERIEKGVALKYELHTHNSELPCWVFASCFEQLGSLGEQATFAGSILGGRDVTEVAGKFQQIDLFQLIGRSFPHELHGLVTVQLHSLIKPDGSIARMIGQASAESEITVGTSLLLAAQQHLQMGGEATPIGPNVGLSKLKFKFESNLNTIEVTGLCDENGGVMLDQTGQILLRSNVGNSISIASIAQTLLPDGKQHIAINRNCRNLLAWFPDNTELR
jgi:hypothetical protein